MSKFYLVKFTFSSVNFSSWYFMHVVITCMLVTFNFLSFSPLVNQKSESAFHSIFQKFVFEFCIKFWMPLPFHSFLFFKGIFMIFFLYRMEKKNFIQILNVLSWNLSKVAEFQLWDDRKGWCTCILFQFLQFNNYDICRHKVEWTQNQSVEIEAVPQIEQLVFFLFFSLIMLLCHQLLNQILHLFYFFSSIILCSVDMNSISI